MAQIFKIEIQKGGPNNSAVLQNWFPPKKLGPPSLIWGNLKKLRNVLLNPVECIEIYWMTKNLDGLNFQNWNAEGGDQIIQLLCRIGSPQEISSPLINLRKFEKTEKSSAESCKMHWNLLDDEEFGRLKFLKLNYRRGDQIIQPFCRIGSPQEIRYPPL